MNTLFRGIILILCLLSLTACSNVSRQDVGLVTGGVLGGFAGSALSHGSTAGTIAGAVAGGFLGREVAN